MVETRTERHQINKSHPYFKLIDGFCCKSKNLYNYANYIIRQEFINNGNYISTYEMAKNLKTTEPYKELMSQASQCTLQVLDKNWRSYFKAIKDWKVNKHKYLGMPKKPYYKDKDGRFPWFLKNNQTYIKDGYLYFKLKAFEGYKFKTKVTERLISVRFVPKNSIYTMEIVYEHIINEIEDMNNNILGIDLGVNNLATMVNNIGLSPVIINGKPIKSINQYWNKQKANLMNDLERRNQKHWSNKLDKITNKRENKIHNYFHNASKFIIDYCCSNNIQTIVIGKNKKWKQKVNIGHENNQHFVCIPYEKLIQMIEYKAKDKQIKVILTEESYTSGTSFLDNELPIKQNYDKSRRIKRGLFKSNNGTLINSDVNGALQIIKKVFPSAFANGVKGGLVPTIIDLGN